jgi:hypothetical protein
MRQPSPTLPITTKMLRHFAVVTVAITACIGIFANGENSKVAARSMNEMAHHSGVFSIGFSGTKRASLGGSGNRQTSYINGMKLAAATNLNSSGGDDSNEPSLQSGESFGTIQNDHLTVQPPLAGSAMGTSTANLGNEFAAQAAAQPIPKDELGVPAPGAATPTNSLLKRPKPQPPRKATQQEIDQMMAASSHRSGGAATE